MLLQMVGFPSFLNTAWYSIIRVHHIFSVHSSVGGPLDCFRILNRVSDAAVNMGLQIISSIYWFQFFWTCPQSGISRSYGSSIFNFLRHSGCPILYSHQQCTRFPVSSHLQVLPTLVTFYFSDNNHHNRCEVRAHLLFSFAFLWWLVTLSTFACTHWPFTWVH